MIWKNSLLIFFISVVVGFAGFAQVSTEIIGIDQVLSRMHDSNVVILDVRKIDQYNQGHIPGSRSVWRPDFENQNAPFRGVMASKEKMELLLGQLGVFPETELMLYDDKGLCDASRLWWILSYYGHSKFSLIDGGLQAWRLKGNELSLKVTVFDRTNYTFLEPINEKNHAAINDVKIAITDPDVVLVDVRTLKEYTGETMKKGAFRSGRIPTAIWCDWASSIDYDSTQKFKPYSELKNWFENKGITADKKIITYCQSGVRSAHSTFVLTQILGYENVKNFDGSWIEWSYYDSLPIDSGDLHILASHAEIQINRASYWELFKNSFGDFANYSWNEITFNVQPVYVNYFWLLVFLSLLIWGLEIVFPWRKDQPIIRKDFWLDAFYMFFNFYIFKLVIFIAFSNVTEQLFKDALGGDLTRFSLLNLSKFPEWAQLLIFFIAVDFIQWFTHVLLHRFDFLYKFHKIHHSVEQMGFAAHLRFHWMENVFYTPMKYIAVMLLGGFTPDQVFIVYYLSIAIGHLNHANINISYGPLKYIFNNPKMHIWHHAFHLPDDRKRGVNFGISLSLWDYIFRTNYIPSEGRDIKLGFEGLKEFPSDLLEQLTYGFTNSRNKKS